MSTAFVEEDQWMKKTEQRTGYGAIEIAKVHVDGYNLDFRKIEGYIPSSLGARSIPFDRLRQKCSYWFLIF